MSRYIDFHTRAHTLIERKMAECKKEDPCQYQKNSIVLLTTEYTLHIAIILYRTSVWQQNGHHRHFGSLDSISSKTLSPRYDFCICYFQEFVDFENTIGKQQQQHSAILLQIGAFS